MSTLPRVGMLAGHGVDSTAWQHAVQLPASFRWQWITPEQQFSLLDLDAFVWLWNPQLPQEFMRAEQEAIQQWLVATLRTRQNQLIPFVLVATGSPHLVDDAATQQAMNWAESTVAMMKQTYRKELHGLVPGALVDISRITLQADTETGGKQLCEQLATLRTHLHHWQGKTARQAERCLAAGLMLTAMYVVMLLLTIPWQASAVKQPKSADPIAWSRNDWQYHLTDCRQLLGNLAGRPFEKLSVQEQERFTEHLRWLPISADWLQQRRATKEVQQLRGQVQDLLTQVESLIDSWSKTVAASPVEQAAQQAAMTQLLSGVFEPRRPPTVLHQAAQRYWLMERQLTQARVKELLAQNKPLPQRVAETLTLVRERQTQAESSRVHAPELKTAWLQELSSCIAWLEKGQATSNGITAEMLQYETTPSLLR